MSATAPGAAAPPAPALSARTQQMLHAPVVATLFRLATPNVIGMLAAPLVIGYDGFILGRLGADALAGVALVFPLSMLMVQMSGGGMGGATTAAVARALGGGRHDDASRLAQHAIALSLIAALMFTLAQFGFGRAIYGAMGGRGAALADALAYSNVLFGGAVSFWLFNVLAAASRGSGNMLLPRPCSGPRCCTCCFARCWCSAGDRCAGWAGRGRRQFGHDQRHRRGGDGAATDASRRPGNCSGCRCACEPTCCATSCAWACRLRSTR